MTDKKTPPEKSKKEADNANFMYNGKECYWIRPVHLKSIGQVKGKVTEKQMAAFKANAPKNLKLNKWVSSKDLIAERYAKAKAKQKKKLGIKD